MACSAAIVSYSGSALSNRYEKWCRRSSGSMARAALNRDLPKGFGRPQQQQQQQLKKIDNPVVQESSSGPSRINLGPSKRPVREAEDDTVPEVVTNRMLKRMAFTVGVPLTVGLAAFPLYYYSKMVLKMDVAPWLPMMTSMLTFGSAGLGIAYAVMSSSWDPQREGSLLGWNEALVNWGLVWEKKVD